MRGFCAALEFCILQPYKDVTLLSKLPNVPDKQSRRCGIVSGTSSPTLWVLGPFRVGFRILRIMGFRGAVEVIQRF